MEVHCSTVPAPSDFSLTSSADGDLTRLFNMHSEDPGELLGDENLRLSLKMGSLCERQYAILAEKGRRRRMKLYCTQLSLVLPNDKLQTDRFKLYGEAMNYIKELEEQINNLTAKKESLLKIMHGNQQGSASATDSTVVSVFMFGKELSISVTSPRNPRLVSKLVKEIENQNMDVNALQIFSWDSMVSSYFHVFIREEGLMLDQTCTRNLLQDVLKKVY